MGILGHIFCSWIYTLTQFLLFLFFFLTLAYEFKTFLISYIENKFKRFQLMQFQYMHTGEAIYMCQGSWGCNSFL